MRKLAAFLHSHRERIVEEWERRTLHQLPSSQQLSRRARRDHVPQLIDAMATAIDRDDTTMVSLEQLPLIHADERWLQDYDLREVVAEYRLLRRVILDVYVQHIDENPGSEGSLPPLVTLNENIDHAITDAVDHYTMQRDRTREYFVGMLSHDLRDPLNSIAMSAELLQREGLQPADQLRLAARVASSAVRMRRLIDDMLDVTRSRLGAGLPVSPVQVDLREVLNETVDELAAAHPDRDLRHGIEGGEDLVGQWDPMRLAQAISNLVANAFKHGRDPIRVSARGERDSVVLQVENGGEVPATLRAHLFEPFETRDPTAGSGLGLFIAAEIARVHGGTLVLVDDTPGMTCFRLTLPRSVPEPATH